MTEPLSPAAEAVFTAILNLKDNVNPRHRIAAAALRAAADCLWVDKPDGANGVYEAHRAQLLDIAAELEGNNV